MKSTLTQAPPADYGPSIEGFTDTLLTRIEKNEGKVVVLNDLCIHYSYDVMSALAFGDSTRFLEGKSTEVATKILNNTTEGIVAVGALLHVPWVSLHDKTAVAPELICLRS
jgi:cytochrome P450